MTTFTINDTPADIVKVFPKSSDLFKKNRIDFCCGGDKPLAEVFAKKNMNEGAILGELNASYLDWKSKGNVETDWDQISNSELVDHVVHTHHAYLTEELPALGQFVTKIYRVHGGSHPHLVNLHKLYNTFKMELESHMVKEEQDLFPLIKKYDVDPSPELLEKIRTVNTAMEEEHDTAGDLLKQMHDITNGFEPPVDACNSYRITYARLAELEGDTFQHIHLENNILFKKLA
ncbi:iron-sulfur cluster repair di-iron protein [Aquibacillus halophilus]|uniref:Iron-sulfur cluster repair di-iron protein n=1 Tax=Aquibacillus halophilus TaxID=930132 RepID=A0A6A8DBQ9_9BACI|nr:iron-sulfur cluster repair di-iron protein [Aquibacillus halophilus]MRH42740.1 iron-sulfur cluster repair di-iron protein [Aquibacillus halophilus]